MHSSKYNYLAGHVCGDNVDLIDGHPTGSVRISFGYMSTFVEAQKFLKFIKHCFVENGNAGTIGGRESSVLNQEKGGSIPLKQVSEESVEIPSSKPEMVKALDRFELKKICLFPIKSCGGFEVRMWNA